ncbi:tetraacyldisaccharide 4'-kinase [Marichromatium gracile]|uniref:Tetraacyldisaccharide 4'-kinase n=1 Tax=Marichromatium gracile TaxID=1048 RepID=A0A4R4A6C0_MARGR|nr:tetraacyldisaccharide 4'-kinase [Marichromatium gracile]MBK1708696.1 tetraacyldisaccharide 4'-kinase [Marichromatium gracile]TCW34308.1 lipid-A-disaccharide kinase [Marichromatium gracile]
MRWIDPARVWYARHWLGVLLAPLGALYCALAMLRRLGFRRGWLASTRLPVPVVVVGNLSVGGTGKTPAVIALARLLREHGWRPAVLTRGYGRREDGVRRVAPSDTPEEVGDEPLLLARHAGCPVVVGADRVAAGRFALDRCDCDLLLTDDGLQHYRLARDIEIAVVDGRRGLGNRRCLPAGPLREPPRRLEAVDLVLHNGGEAPPGAGRMRLVPGAALALDGSGRSRPLAAFRDRRVCAVAGIGNPDRFFAMLETHGLMLDPRPYPDHHDFTAAEVAAWPAGPVLMTEKDAVKCARFGGGDHWYVPVEAEFDADSLAGLLTRLARVKRHG